MNACRIRRRGAVLAVAALLLAAGAPAQATEAPGGLQGDLPRLREGQAGRRRHPRVRLQERRRRPARRRTGRDDLRLHGRPRVREEGRPRPGRQDQDDLRHPRLLGAPVPLHLSHFQRRRESRGASSASSPISRSRLRPASTSTATTSTWASSSRARRPRPGSSSAAPASASSRSRWPTRTSSSSRAASPCPRRSTCPAGESREVELRFPAQAKTGVLRDYVLVKSNDPVRSTLSIYVSRYVISKKELQDLFERVPVGPQGPGLGGTDPGGPASGAGRDMVRMLTVKAQPRAKAPGVEELGPDRFRVRVRAAPDKGRANAEVVERLAAHLGVPAVASDARPRRDLLPKAVPARDMSVEGEEHDRV